MAGQGGGAWGSLLSASEFAAVEGTGFDPVGQVLGTAVFHVPDYGGWCPGSWSAYGSTSVSSSPGGSYAAYVQAVYKGRRTALGRLASECRALGGDGVVGVRMRIAPFPSGGTEFTAIGTAVRARTRSRKHTARTFTAHMGGQDFAKLVHSGWMPTGMAYGICMAIRHDDRSTRRQISRWAGNQEVDGYTELVEYARRDARAQLAKNAAPNGGDGVVVDEMLLQVRERDCGQGTRDHAVQAVFGGTSIVRFGRARRPAGPRALTIMRLERES